MAASEVKSKVYINKSQLYQVRLRGFWRKLTGLKINTLVAATVALILLSTLTSLFLSYFFLRTNSKPETDRQLGAKFLKNHQGPLYGVSGTITSLSKSGSDRLLVLDSNLGSSYHITVGPKTQIFSVTRQLTEKEVKKTQVQIQPDQLKIGDRIYIESNKDLKTLNEAKIDAANIRSIEVYQ